MNEAPETITLKESGLVLTKMEPWDYTDFRARVGGLPVRIYQDRHGRWWTLTFGGGFNGYATRAEAEDDADSALVALRSALLPPDAVVVRTGDARERVIQAITEVRREAQTAGAEFLTRYLATEVLAALGIGGGR